MSHLVKKIAILGSTGSIGTQTLEVLENPAIGEVFALVANDNLELLESQIRKWKPKFAVIKNERKAEILKKNVSDLDITILDGDEGILDIVSHDEVDLVVNAIMGFAGLNPTIRAIKAGKNIALANKETLVSAGEIVMALAKEKNVMIFPIDSEHSAIYQCLQGNAGNKIETIYLTASGGAFRGKSLDEIKPAPAPEALKHPTWSMGKKITIDSATLMNKGLEVIEAKWLFDLEIDKIKILIHPQSKIHSMVEFEDGSVISQLGETDMRLPIQYSLTYPYRIKNSFKKLDFSNQSVLTFSEPEISDFPCLRIAYDCLRLGGNYPTIMNAANEIAVAAFLENKIEFSDIPRLIHNAVYEYRGDSKHTIEDAISLDKWARDLSLEWILKRIPKRERLIWQPNGRSDLFWT